MARRNDQGSEIKDFIAFKTAYSFQIKPQTSRGWWAGFIWTLILLTPTLPFVLLAATVDDTPEEIWVFYALVPYLLLTGLIGWAMMRWMMARAEILQRDDQGNWTSDSNKRTGRGRMER